MTRIWDTYLTDLDKRVYEASGYGLPQELGTRPALVVVDVNYGFVGDRPLPVEESVKTWRNSCGDVGWQAMDHIARLLETTRAQRIPTFFSTGTAARKDHFDRGAWDYKNSRATEPMAPQVRAMMNEIPEKIAPRPHEFLITKYKPSVFFGTALVSFLTSLHVDTLVVCGTTTSGCVRGTVIDAFNLNYHLAVVEEATFDRFESSHAINLFDMNAKYADVISTDATIEYFTSLPAGIFDDLLSFGGDA